MNPVSSEAIPDVNAVPVCRNNLKLTVDIYTEWDLNVLFSLFIRPLYLPVFLPPAPELLSHRFLAASPEINKKKRRLFCTISGCLDVRTIKRWIEMNQKCGFGSDVSSFSLNPGWKRWSFCPVSSLLEMKMHYFAQTVVFLDLRNRSAVRVVLLLWNDGLNKWRINKLI